MDSCTYKLRGENGSDPRRGHLSTEFWTWPGYLLLFLMLAFPMVLSLLYIKALLFVLLLILVAVRGVTRFYVHLHLKVAAWTLAIAIVSLFFCIRGMFLGAPGAVKCTQVYVVWPLVYLLLLSGVDKVRIFQGLVRTMVFTSGFIGIFGMAFSLSQVGLIPPIPFFNSLVSSDELSSGFYAEHVELAFPGLNSLPFLVPFLVAMIAAGRGEPRRNFLRIWMWLALLVDLIVVILSGRRALQLVTVLAPLLTLIVGSFLPNKERLLLRRSLGRFALNAVLVIALSVPLLRSIYPITYEGVVERFSTGFDFSPTSVDDSPEARRQQFFALGRGWIEDPLIGNGLGASAHGSIRSETMPWAYELYYLDLLFQTGLLGFVTYAAGVIWIFSSSIKIIKRGAVGSELLIPVIVGMTALLIATATNPYLARFDGIWVIFLPLAYINHWLITGDRGVESLTRSTQPSLA